MDPQGVRPFQLVKTIHDLPTELLGQIFGYMTHTGRLISRLVCKDWNEKISTDLSKTSYYDLESRNSNEVLLDSNIEWTEIKIKNCGQSVLPKEFKNMITHLELVLSKSEIGFPHWMKFLIGFPNLTSLDLDITDEEHEVQDPSGINSFGILRPDFIEMTQTLKNLSITFPYNNYKALNGLLEEFVNEAMCLKNFCIKENKLTVGGITISTKSQSVDLITNLLRIISTSSSTLTSLDLEFNSKILKSKLTTDLISKLSEVRDLKLESALIRHEPIEGNVQNDFLVLQEFLNIQKTTGVLKNLVLPWSSDVSHCQEFVNTLPQDIERVGNVRTEHITDEFPKSFKKLKYLSIGEDIETQMFSEPEECKNIRELKVDLLNYDFIFDPENTFFAHITDAMVNLTTLEIIGNGRSSFEDADLQNIISALNQLRVLHLERCVVSDIGVTGVDVANENIQESIRTKRLYFYPKSFPKADVVNRSISSLKNLEILHLTDSRISDVGIVLGFQFGSRLKHLTLGSKSDNVSDLGLHCLGTNNPGLEAFYGYFKSSEISSIGVDNLKKQLPLIESTQKFRLTNKF